LATSCESVTVAMAMPMHTTSTEATMGTGGTRPKSSASMRMTVGATAIFITW
jgi:hypothetical protein